MYPAAREIMIHYNPASPGESVLRSGIGGVDLFAGIFMTPFNVIMLVGWASLLKWVRGWWDKRPAGGVPVLCEDNETAALRLAPFTPLTAAAVTAAGTSFLMVFAVALIFGFDSMQGAAVGWGLIVGLSITVYFGVVSRTRAGRYDLVIDRPAGTVTLPAIYGCKSPATIRISQVKSVDMTVEESTGENASTKYAPMLRWYGACAGDVRNSKLGEFAARERAESLATWVRERITSPTSSTAGSRHAIVA
jgi:hypothetical protein